MWVKKVIAAAVTITMLTTSASTLSVMADAENTTTETETAVDSTESVSDAEQEVQQLDAQTNESDNETVDSVQKDEQNVAEKDAKLAALQLHRSQRKNETAADVQPYLDVRFLGVNLALLDESRLGGAARDERRQSCQQGINRGSNEQHRRNAALISYREHQERQRH